MNEKEKKTSNLNFRNYGVLIVLVVLFVVMSLASPAFLTARNLMNLVRQVAVIGVIAIGTTFVCLTGGIDISVGPGRCCQRHVCIAERAGKLD